MTQDERNLKLLSIFHYVFAGLIAACACIILVRFTRLNREFDDPTLGELLPWPFIFLPSIGWMLVACCILAAAHGLRRRRLRTFCLVAAAVECCITPLGTPLGVFTIVILMKDSVKQLFAAGTPPAVSLGPAPKRIGITSIHTRGGVMSVWQMLFEFGLRSC